MKQPIKIVEKLFAAWNSHRPQEVMECYHEEFRRQDVSNHLSYNKQTLLKVVQSYLYAFPDVSFYIDEVVDNEERIVVCWTATGHHRGKIMNIPPTGKYISFNGVSILHIQNELIMKVWYLWDEASMLRQMGLLPESQHTT
ncbi:MAG: ester cyclase [Chitinophagales bacterium]|nr:ester cyclase [Chitinophagales bacterium]